MFESTNQYPLFGVLYKGGWVMVPLVLCSFISLAVVIERLIWGPNRRKILPQKLVQEVIKLIDGDRLDELLGLCRASNTPLARIILVALQNISRPRSEVMEAVEIAGRNEAMNLQRYIGALGTIASISPLLGLLGTVFGMIKTFAVVQSQNMGNPQALAGGIAEALITTAAGLTIGIPSLVFYRYFLGKTRKLVVEMESLAVQVVSKLSQSVENGVSDENAATHKNIGLIKGSQRSI
jgi:biopolymer transport protein ExbB